MASFSVCLICIFFLQIFLLHGNYADQIRGVIVDPNAPKQPGSPQGTTPETIYFGTTGGRRGSSIGGSGPGAFREGNDDEDGKWVRRSTGMPIYQRTTPNFGGDGDGDGSSTDESITEDPYSRRATTERYRPFVRTTEEPDNGNGDGDGETTEDPYGQATTSRYSRFGSRYSTEDPFKRFPTTSRYRPFGRGDGDGDETTEDPFSRYRGTTDRYSRFGMRTTEDPFGRGSGRATERYRPFGRGDGDGDGTTEDPFSRYRGTTDRYSRFGMRTTEDPFGRGSGRPTERYRPFGRGDGDGAETTEDPFSRYRGTTDRYSRYGIRTTEDPFQRGFGRTTPRYGRLPGDGDETTEGPLWGRRTTPDYGLGSFGRRTTPDYSRPDRYRPATDRYSRYGTTEDTISGASGGGRDDANAQCQASSRSGFVYGRNVCLEYINCCQRTCLAKGMKPKGNCRHDTDRGFDAADTFCNCRPT